MPFAFLLAMQAAGMVIDWYGQRQQMEMGRAGARVEQEGIAANIAMTRAETEDQTVKQMQTLRQTLGTQAAILASRGTRGNAGSALLFSTNSMNDYKTDQRILRMNQLSKEGQLRAQGVISKLHQYSQETQMTQSLTKRMFNMIPTNPGAYSEIGKSFGIQTTQTV